MLRSDGRSTSSIVSRSGRDRNSDGSITVWAKSFDGSLRGTVTVWKNLDPVTGEVPSRKAAFVATDLRIVRTNGNPEPFPLGWTSAPLLDGAASYGPGDFEADLLRRIDRLVLVEAARKEAARLHVTKCKGGHWRHECPFWDDACDIDF